MKFNLETKLALDILKYIHKDIQLFLPMNKATTTKSVLALTQKEADLTVTLTFGP